MRRQCWRGFAGGSHHAFGTGQVGIMLGQQSDRLMQPAVGEEHVIVSVPAPTFASGEMARQIAEDPEFAAAFGREPRNPW